MYPSGSSNWSRFISKHFPMFRYLISLVVIFSGLTVLFRLSPFVLFLFIGKRIVIFSTMSFNEKVTFSNIFLSSMVEFPLKFPSRYSLNLIWDIRCWCHIPRDCQSQMCAIPPLCTRSRILGRLSLMAVNWPAIIFLSWICWTSHWLQMLSLWMVLHYFSHFGQFLEILMLQHISRAYVLTIPKM